MNIMVTKARSPGQTAISLSMPEDVVRELDRRAAALHLNRSTFILQLIKQDLAERPDLVLRETPIPGSRTDTERKVVGAVKSGVAPPQASEPKPTVTYRASRRVRRSAKSAKS